MADEPRGCSDSSCSESSCSGCSNASCGSSEPKFEELLPGVSVKKVIGIVSGKGGVGKSLVTSLLATHFNREGKSVAVLDADATGPSIPRMLGVKGGLYTTPRGIIPGKSESGIQVMSTNLMLPDDTDPVIWRGPVVAGMIKQFWTEVEWGQVDYLFVDMPPGTGDVPLSVFQMLPVDGIVIVTSPQELVGMIVTKAVKMAEKMDIPVLGIVENMSYFVCPDCGKKTTIFGESHIEEIAWEHDIKCIAKMPMNPAVAAACDAGKVDTIIIEELTPIINELESLS